MIWGYHYFRKHPLKPGYLEFQVVHCCHSCHAWEYCNRQRWADHCPQHCPKKASVLQDSCGTMLDKRHKQKINSIFEGFCCSLHFLTTKNYGQDWELDNYNFRIEVIHGLNLFGSQTHGGGILPVQPWKVGTTQSGTTKDNPGNPGKK